MEQLDKLASAFVALQADLKPVAKSANNPFYKSSYAPLSEVMESIQPILAKHKLAITQFPTNLDGVSALQTVLVHESGQTLQFAPVPLLLTKQDAQSQGSAMTYARRYGVMAVLGLVADEDDDGNKASAPAPVVDQLPKAKSVINAALIEQGYTTNEAKTAFITKVLGVATINNLNAADSVMDAIENEG